MIALGTVDVLLGLHHGQVQFKFAGARIRRFIRASPS